MKAFIIITNTIARLRAITQNKNVMQSTENDVWHDDEEFKRQWHSLHYPDPETLPPQYDPQRDGN